MGADRRSSDSSVLGLANTPWLVGLGFLGASVKVTIFSEAERELPGKEMVWNMGLTTATVPRGCPNGFVFFKDVYHFE